MSDLLTCTKLQNYLRETLSQYLSVMNPCEPAEEVPMVTEQNLSQHLLGRMTPY